MSTVDQNQVQASGQMIMDKFVDEQMNQPIIGVQNEDGQDIQEENQKQNITESSFEMSSVGVKTQLKLVRRFSKVEKQTIEAALEQVKLQGDSYKKSGLSPDTFFLGQINIAFTWYLLGAAPESYWILMMLKCYFYLGCIWHHRLIKKPKEILYMAEFCWVACHAYMIFLTCALLSAVGIEWEWLKGLTYSRTFFYAFWGAANGPFAFSTLGFKNALVLHDLPNLASAFIHLTPSSLSWTLRWWQPAVDKQWPGIFNIPDINKPKTETFLDLFLPCFIFYGIWWILYVIWLITIGRHHGLPHTQKYDTIYHETMRTQKWFHKINGYDASTDETRKRIMPIIIFQVCHGLVMTVSVAFSYLVWWNFWLHTAWCCILFCSCTWYGAVRYFNMMTKYYLKSLEKIVRGHISSESLIQLPESLSARDKDIEKGDANVVFSGKSLS